MEVGLLEAQPREDVLDLVVQCIGIVVGQDFVEPVELLGEDLLLVRRCVGHLLGHLHQLVLRFHQLVEGTLGFVEQRATGWELRHLPKQPEACPCMELHLTGFGFVDPSQHLDERGLARTVGADEAHALAHVQLERDLLEQRGGVVAPGHVRATHQQHGGAYSCRVGRRREFISRWVGFQQR